MSHLLADVHAHDAVAIFAVYLVKAPVHLAFCTESLDDAETAQCFFYHAHGVAPERLCLCTLCLQFLAHQAHEPAERWNKKNGEESELPTDADKGDEVEEYQNRVLEKHVER